MDGPIVAEPEMGLPPLSPRSMFTRKNQRREQASMQLMTHLDSSRVKLVKQAFEENGGSVDLYEFVRTMQKHLPPFVYQDSGSSDSGIAAKLTPEELTANLVELFEEVDVNGDGDMEWEEFTRFMVEKAALFKEQSTMDKVSVYSHNPRLGNDTTHRHRESIDGITMLPRHQQFGVIEQHSPYITLYNARSSNFVANLRCNAVPLGMCYVEPLNALVAACSDMTMVRWNVGDCPRKFRYQQHSKWPTPDTQMSLCWQKQHALLYSGSVAGTVHSWDVEKREQRSCLYGHTDIVMEVLSIDYLENVVSASLDTSIRIWDTYTEQQTTKLMGHSKGVNSLAYNSSHRFLISSGFDHDVFIWSPFVNTLLYKLKGHKSALVGCETVEGTSELITADCNGIFKLWDLRNFQCIDTFTSDHEPGDVDDLTGCLNCFGHVKLPPNSPNQEEEDYRLVAASKKLFVFDQERIRKEPVTDDVPLRIALFNEQSLTIFTTSECSVKIWDAVLGTLKRFYKNVAPADISAACLDDRQRKFIIGDVSGGIAVYNYQNGALMKSFTQPGSSPVVQLTYCDTSKTVLAAYTDGIIRVYDENDIEICQVLRTFDEAYMHVGDLNCVAYLDAGSIVASGGNDPSDGVRIWDFETGKCDLVLKTDNYEVVTMQYLDDFPLLVVCSSDSMIRFWGMRHSVYKGACVALLPNDLPPNARVLSGDSPETSSANDEPYVGASPVPTPTASSPRARRMSRRRRISSMGAGNPLPMAADDANRAPVTSMAWSKESECIYCGDESGHLRKWDLSGLLAHLDTGTLQYTHTAGRRRVGISGGSGSNMDHEMLQGMLQRDPFERAVEFLRLTWAFETAHEDAITVVQLNAAPMALLTASTDRCVKMWGVDGQPMGLLLQGIPANVKNPKWNLSIDVAGREGEEQAKTARVMSVVSERELEDDERKKIEAADNERSAVAQRRSTIMSQFQSMFSPGDAAEHGDGEDGDETVGTLGNHSRASGATPHQATSTARRETHDRVLGVLNDVRTMHVNTASASRTDMSSDRSVGSRSLNSSHRVGDPSLRDRNRRLPPYMDRTDDALEYPPIELTGLGPGLDARLRSQQARVRRQQQQEVLDSAPKLAFDRSKLPPLPQVRPVEVEPMPTVVPPSPGRAESLDPEVVASLDRLNAELNNIENDEGASAFDVKRSTGADFTSRPTSKEAL